MALSIDRAAFKDDFWFIHAVYERLLAKSKRLTGDEWAMKPGMPHVTAVEVDTFTVIQFLYSWDNNGRFIDTVKWYEDTFDRVDQAFRRLGFATASVLMPRALELHELQQPYYTEDLPLPADLDAETIRVNEAASNDVSEERLAQAIIERAAEFDV